MPASCTDLVSLIAKIKGQHFKRLPYNTPDLHGRNRHVTEHENEDFSQPADIRPHDQPEQQRQSETVDQGIDDESQGLGSPVTESKWNGRFNLEQVMLVRIDDDLMKIAAQYFSAGSHRMPSGRACREMLRGNTTP